VRSIVLPVSSTHECTFRNTEINVLFTLRKINFLVEGLLGLISRKLRAMELRIIKETLAVLNKMLHIPYCAQC
jgi:hypothetical protein